MIRCGVNSDVMQNFKEELIIYPSESQENEEPTEKAGTGSLVLSWCMILMAIAIFR